MGVCCASQSQKQKQSFIPSYLQPNKQNLLTHHFRLIICLFTSNKSAHNLVDFDNTSLTMKTIEVDFPSRICLVDKDIVALQKHEKIDQSFDLFEVYFNQNFVYVREINKHQDSLIWQVLRNQICPEIQSQCRREFTINDTIKLGRIQLMLLEYSLNYSGQSQLEIEQLQEERISQDFSMDQSSCCRICFSKIATIQNPLISPCKCSGSMKYIHLKCLQGWLNPHVKIKRNDNIIQYIWKKIDCELCKTNYKISFMYDNKYYLIISVPKPQTPYMMYKVIVEDKQNQSVLVYVVELPENKQVLKIGRIPECDIKLKDISVSRTHATIYIDHGNLNSPLSIEDNGSKFGTLVSVQKLKMPVAQIQRQHSHKSEVAVYQTGRMLFTLSAEKKTLYQNVSCYKIPPNIPPIQVLQDCQQQIYNIADYSFMTHNQGEVQEEILVNNISTKPNAKIQDQKICDDLKVADENST